MRGASLLFPITAHQTETDSALTFHLWPEKRPRIVRSRCHNDISGQTLADEWSGDIGQYGTAGIISVMAGKARGQCGEVRDDRRISLGIVTGLTKQSE